MIPGTFNPPSGRGLSGLISRLAGSNIGNATAFGGLAAGFDGVTNQVDSACAGKSNVAANTCWIGKTFAFPTAMDDALIHGSNNSGFASGSNPSVTIQRYGKVGAAPANETDGVLVGTLTFTETSNESAGRLIPCTDKFTYFNHGWYRITQGTNANLYVAECVFNGWQ